MKENDIRPDEIFQKYLNFAKIDCDKFFLDSATAKTCCPVHQNSSGKEIFIKNNFHYRECQICNSIFVSPRHNLKNYEEFYLKGESVRFWSQEFYKKTEKSRKEKLWEPKVNQLVNSDILDFPISDYSVIDVGGGYGVFAELISKKGVESVLVIEPNKELAQICRNKGIKVIEKFANQISKHELPKHPKIITSFELFEHLYDPSDFIESLKKIMNKGDILYMTTLTSSGIDIKILREKSKAVTPPHHINFLSVKGAFELFKKIGFSEVKVETPGKLDLDILKKQKESIEDVFLSDVFRNFDQESLEELQRLISNNKMSSHMLIKAKL